MKMQQREVKPDCYQCRWRHDLPGDCHSGCGNNRAHVTGDSHGIKMGWFFWPYNFDPLWLKTCDGFEKKNEYERQRQT